MNRTEKNADCHDKRENTNYKRSPMAENLVTALSLTLETPSKTCQIYIYTETITISTIIFLFVK